MSKSSTVDTLRKAAALLARLQEHVGKPAMLQDIMRQGSTGHVCESLRRLLAEHEKPTRAQLTPQQINGAMQVCTNLVAAYVYGEDPRSIDWADLDRCNALARQVIGRGAVKRLYKRLRPEVLPADPDESSSPAP